MSAEKKNWETVIVSEPYLDVIKVDDDKKDVALFDLVEGVCDSF